MKPNVYTLIAATLLTLLLSVSTFAQQAKVTVNQDPKIPQMLGLMKSLEKDNKLMDGYTIQLYYGELKKANDIIYRYKGSFAEWPAAIEYETPNYKVWVGNFATRMEADRALRDIQKMFPAAFIFKPNKK